ncbi:MAG: acetoin utilization protein AcuC [Planctomycetota bacterium]
MSARILDPRPWPTYDFGEGHVFAPDRQLPLFDLLETTSLLRSGDALASEALDFEGLRAVHRRDYLEHLRDLDQDPALRRSGVVHGLGSLDNPIRPGQYDACAAIAGAAVEAVRAIVNGRHRRIFHPAGGLHHAMPATASGFCLVNDLGLSIHEALSLGLERVAYIDFDVHHGDGVEAIFAEDPRVLTISFHEDPAVRWPHTGRIEDRGRGAGRGSVLNIPLAPGTTDRSLVECCESVSASALDAFRPQLLVTQHGCDPHLGDPLADLSVGTRAFLATAELARDLAEKHCDGRWLATGGGGYQPYTVLPLAWSIVWSVLSDRRLPDDVPPEWRARWENHAQGSTPMRFLEDEPTDPRRRRAAEINSKTVRELGTLSGLF